MLLYSQQRFDNPDNGVLGRMSLEEAQAEVWSGRAVWITSADGELNIRKTGKPAPPITKMADYDRTITVAADKHRGTSGGGLTRTETRPRKAFRA